MQDADEQVAEEDGPIAFTGGPILTMTGTRADVVVIAGDRIIAVGDRGLLMGHRGAVHDLGGRTLCPGFIDAHNHLSIAALHPEWADLGGATDMDELGERLRVHAAANPEVEWIRGFGWDDHAGTLVPDRLALDRLGLDRPIVVAHSTLHQCVVDSRALAELGIGASSPDPVGGEIGRGADGQPNGLLLERAWGEAHARSLAAYADPDRWADHIAVRAGTLLREGITAVHDAACAPAAEAVYRTMAGRGHLPISVLGMPHAAALLANDLGGRRDGPPTGEGGEWFRVGPAKLFADGGIAIALDVTMSGHPIRFGMVMADLEQEIVATAARGFRVAVHAIGNVGVDAAIGAFAEVRRRVGDGDHRFRVEHAGVTSPTQCRALAGLGAVGVVQPGFVEHVGCQSQGARFDHHHWLAFADLAEAGVPLAGSSDDPCAPFPPLWCAAKGASRLTSTGIEFEREQAVPLDDWLYAYTAGAAFAGEQEHERGRLLPGLRADLVVLDRTGATPTVSETWVSGRQVHTADAP